MSKVMMVDANRCTGCRVCELACSMIQVGEYNPARSKIRVLQNRELDVNIPVVQAGCDQCEECVRWCFSEAIRFTDAKEAALIHKELKIGTFPVPFMPR